MFSFRLKQPTALISSIRDLPRAARTAFNIEMRDVVKPAVQREVQDLVATYPGPVVYPFQFATARSRRAFFATNGFGKGIPTQRDGTLYRAWKTSYNFSEQVSSLFIRNSADYAKYVYGSLLQQQVAGHRNTGWGRDTVPALQLIDKYATDQIIDAWGRAVGLAVERV